MKSALFVDFDNIFSGLRQLDQNTADRFARRPGAWMDWLIESLSLPEHSPVGAKRRVLVRRCYLNPQAYQRFRPSFNLAGFEIVDCPALTMGGKTSTDIHMVLDIVELLQHETRYDEFIVLSADADFTPVLRKLRRWDRRTTVLAIGFPSAAYRASADLLIDQDDFVRNALGFDDEAGSAQAMQTVASASRRTNSVSQPSASLGSRQPPEIATRAASLVMEEVAKSSWPVPCSRLATLIIEQDSSIAMDWNGHGTFRRMMESLDIRPVVLDWADSGGVAYDPARHSVAIDAGITASQDDWGDARDLQPIARQIHEVTGVPLLSPERYRNLFAAIEADVSQHSFQLMETGKRVRDRCKETGKPVSRADVNFVLRGLLMRAHLFDEGKNNAATLAGKLADNVRSLCLREQMVIDMPTEAAIKGWIGGTRAGGSHAIL